MKNAHVICAAAQAGEQKNLPRNLSHFCALGTTAPGEGSPCAPGSRTQGRGNYRNTDKSQCVTQKWAQPLQSCPGYRIIVTRSGNCCMQNTAVNVYIYPIII